MPLPDLQDSHVLVTGGAGFIGSHLVDALLARGARVRVLDDLSTGRRENLAHCASGIELIEGDIRDLQTCRDAIAGCRYVFHQAALGSVPRSIEDPATSLEVNVQGTVHVLTGAKEAQVERVVFASSSSVFGDSDLLPKREGEEGQPLSPYAASKQIDEDVAAVFGTCYDLEWVGLRYFNVYGSRQDPEGPYAAVIPRFFKAALQGEAMTIYGDGEQSRDFTHVTDAVRANLLAAGADASACGFAYNVAAGTQTTVNELAREIGQLCGATAEPTHLEARPGDVKHSLADLALVHAALGYEPETALAEGLRASLEYYRRLFAKEHA